MNILPTFKFVRNSRRVCPQVVTLVFQKTTKSSLKIQKHRGQTPQAVPAPVPLPAPVGIPNFICFLFWRFELKRPNPMSKTSQVTSSIKVEVQKTDHERVTLHCYIFHATDATAPGSFAGSQSRVSGALDKKWFPTPWENRCESEDLRWKKTAATAALRCWLRKSRKCRSWNFGIWGGIFEVEKSCQKQSKLKSFKLLIWKLVQRSTVESGSAGLVFSFLPEVPRQVSDCDRSLYNDLWKQKFQRNLQCIRDFTSFPLPCCHGWFLKAQTFRGIASTCFCGCKVWICLNKVFLPRIASYERHRIGGRSNYIEVLRRDFSRLFHV